MITYLLSAPDRVTFLRKFAELISPTDDVPLITLDENGEIDSIHPEVIIDELGPIVRGYVDESGDFIETKRVDKHHVNAAAVGNLYHMLVDGVPQKDENGNLLPAYERSRITLFLNNDLQDEPEAGGLPPGKEGGSGLRLLNDTQIATEQRKFLPVVKSVGR